VLKSAAYTMARPLLLPFPAFSRPFFLSFLLLLPAVPNTEYYMYMSMPCRPSMLLPILSDVYAPFFVFLYVFVPAAYLLLYLCTSAIRGGEKQI
ncbi:hypothetical protein DFH11DRAFT_1623430, partial [Phellopilus nigrolimitatus]